MTRRGPSTLDRLRRPEYTGENRCLPCTVVNVAIAAAASGLVALASPPLGLLAFALSLAAVYVRGYLVPGTPELTKRYLPRSLRRVFGKDPVAERLGDERADADAGDSETGAVTGDSDTDAVTGNSETHGAETGSGDPGDDGAAATREEPTFETLERLRRERERAVDAEAFLVEAGVVEPDDGKFGYALTGAFASELRERFQKEGVGAERLAPLFGVDPGEMEALDRDYPAYEVGVRVRKWPSPAAAALDAAAFEALDDWADRWATVPTEQRVDVVEWVRGLSETCPACGGTVVFREEVVESCCGRFDVTTVACADCGVHLREFDATAVDSRATLRGMTP